MSRAILPRTTLLFVNESGKMSCKGKRGQAAVRAALRGGAELRILPAQGRRLLPDEGHRRSLGTRRLGVWKVIPIALSNQDYDCLAHVDWDEQTHAPREPPPPPRRAFRPKPPPPPPPPPNLPDLPIDPRIRRKYERKD